ATAQAFGRGVERGLAANRVGASLLHDLFGARTLALFREFSETTTADYLSRLLIGSEIREGIAWALRRGLPADRRCGIGAPALVARYTGGFELAGFPAQVGRRDAAARGLWWFARHAGLVKWREGRHAARAVPRTAAAGCGTARHRAGRHRRHRRRA